MRELTVYFCDKCGYYAFYQIPKNAICPEHGIHMTALGMKFQEFMDLDYEERDDLLASLILNMHPSLLEELAAQNAKYDLRRTIGLLTGRIEQLERENKKLSDTVEWMHQLIWDMINERKKRT